MNRASGKGILSVTDRSDMRITSILLAVNLTFPLPVFGADKPAPPPPAGPAVGSKAPAFSLSAGGSAVTLTEYKGRWLLLVFYPKAFAPRDIEEMTALREAYAELKGMNADVLGVSMDPPAVAERFRREQKLPFALASDTDKSVSTAYGALGLGGLFSTRKTMVIDPQGNVAAVIEKIKEKSHGRQALRALRELQAQPAS